MHTSRCFGMVTTDTVIVPMNGEQSVLTDSATVGTFERGPCALWVVFLPNIDESNPNANIALNVDVGGKRPTVIPIRAFDYKRLLFTRGPVTVSADFNAYEGGKLYTWLEQVQALDVEGGDL